MRTTNAIIVQNLVWSPRVNNPLDYIYPDTKYRLITPKGDQVFIKRSGFDFFVTIGEEPPMNTGSNINTCYVLNNNEVGLDVNYMDFLSRFLEIAEQIHHIYPDELIRLEEHLHIWYIDNLTPAQAYKLAINII